MADFISNGVSALYAFQRALDVTSQNISNVATPGYSRQQVELATNPAEQAGNGWVGSGVNVSTITRSYDDALAQQVRDSNSSYSRANEFSTDATQVDNMFADSQSGLSATLQSFQSAVQDLSTNPSSSAPRQVVLTQAQSLASQLQGYDAQLTTLNGQMETRLRSTVTDINSIAQSLAQLNGQIAHDTALNDQPPNDLLDQRDKLIDQLSNDVGVSITPQDGGQINVYIGNGQPLVVGTVAQTLTTVRNPYDPTHTDVALQNAGVTTDITANIGGGTLGGILDFRTQVLDPARSQLGLISVGVASVVNQLQSVGVDANGNPGQPMFAIGGVTVQPNANNTGGATLAVTRSNVSALTGSDYILQKTASGWTLSNATTGASVTLSGSGTNSSPFQADGLSIVVSGAAATGDRFLIHPTAGATAGLSVSLTDPAQIAAATPIETAAGASNTGTATIAGGSVVDPTNPQLQTPATIQFVNATTYTVNGGPNQTYTSGQPISVNGWQAIISGTPASGDTFTVSYNAQRAGDNSNALQLAAAFDSKTLNGGNDSVNTTLSRFIGNLGSITQQAQFDSSAQQTVNKNATDARSNVSGVNLDEEAANMLRYQQAYEAAAHLISVASNLFDTMLSAVKGQ